MESLKLLLTELSKSLLPWVKPSRGWPINRVRKTLREYNIVWIVCDAISLYPLLSLNSRYFLGYCFPFTNCSKSLQKPCRWLWELSVLDRCLSRVWVAMQQLRFLSLPDITLLTTMLLLQSLQISGSVFGTVSISFQVLSPRWFHQSSREDFPLFSIDCCCSFPYFFHSCPLCYLCKCLEAGLTCRFPLTM